MEKSQLYKIFRRVVECGSFTRAADQLQIPRSSVSTAISVLEKQLSIRLIQRTTRRIHVTEQGQKAYFQCGDILAKIEELENGLRDQSMSVKGTIKVNVPGRIGRLIIAPALPDFLEQHPEVSIELGMNDQEIDLIESGVDCVLRAGSLKDSRLIQRKLGMMRLTNVASQDYLQSHGTPFTAQDLDGHYLVSYASPTRAKISPFEWQIGGETFSRDLPYRLAVNSAEGLIAGAIAGLGIIQIPRYDILEHIENGTLTEILPNFVAEPIPLSIIFPHRDHLTNRVRIFMEWLELCVQTHILQRQNVGL